MNHFKKNCKQFFGKLSNAPVTIIGRIAKTGSIIITASSTILKKVETGNSSSSLIIGSFDISAKRIIDAFHIL